MDGVFTNGGKWNSGLRPCSTIVDSSAVHLNIDGVVNVPPPPPWPLWSKIHKILAQVENRLLRWNLPLLVEGLPKECF